MSEYGALNVAALQTLGHPGDYAANLDLLASTAASAQARGADLLITPEMFLSGYDIATEQMLAALDHPIRREICAIAERTGIALLVGAPLPVDAGYLPTNAALLVDRGGNILSEYHKVHLFGAFDRERFLPGNRLGEVTELNGVRLGVLICYDVEFPEAVRLLALNGADAALVPTAQMEPFVIVPEHVIPARAWENQIYIAYVNKVGVEGRFTYVGRSCAVGPDGSILSRASATADDLLLFTISASQRARAQRENPYLVDRQEALYGS